MAAASVKKMTKYAAILNRTRAAISGFVPFYKEANVHAQNVQDWFKLHLEEEWKITMHRCGILYKIAKAPDMPFAGVCFLVMGEFCCKHLKFFQDMDCVHEICLKLGQSTDTGVLMDGVPSVTTSTSSIQHMTQDHIFFTLKKKVDFSGIISTNAYIPMHQHMYQDVIDKHAWWEDDEVNRRLDSLERWKGFSIDSYANSRMPHKSERVHKTKFKAVTILHYEPPFLNLRVESNARFHAKTFVDHFKHVFDTDCCVTACERISFGPVTKQDCLQKHEMYFRELKESANIWTPVILDWMKPHAANNAIKWDKRLR